MNKKNNRDKIINGDLLAKILNVVLLIPLIQN